MEQYAEIAKIVAYLAIFFLADVYLLYPLFLIVAAKLFGREIKEKKEYAPTVAVIIAAHNEENLIEDAVASIYASDYDKSKIETLIGSDGSEDGTFPAAKKLAEIHKTLKVYEFDRIGKNAVLNNLLKQTDAEIVWFLDADTRLSKNSIKESLKILGDDSTGCVIPELKISEKDANAGGMGEYLYQKYEKVLRKAESEIFGSVNAFGPSAYKRNLLEPIPNDLVCDDMYFVLTILSKKKRAIFDERISVTEVREKAAGEEMRRRARLAAGGIAAALARKELLNPFRGWPAVFLWNHKLFRHATPFAFAALLAATPALDKSSFLFFFLVIAQILLYGGAILETLLSKFEIKFFPSRACLFIVNLNLGYLAGFFKYLFKSNNAVWERGT